MTDLTRDEHALMNEQTNMGIPMEVAQAEPIQAEKAKPKAKPKKKAAPRKKAAKRNTVTKAELEVQVKELQEQVELANNKAEFLFKENSSLRSKVAHTEEHYLRAFGILGDSIRLALNSAHLHIHK